VTDLLAGPGVSVHSRNPRGWPDLAAEIAFTVWIAAGRFRHATVERLAPLL
jgi:hypothetical protein